MVTRYSFINPQRQRSPFIPQPTKTAIAIISSTYNYSDRALLHQLTKKAIAIISSTHNHSDRASLHQTTTTAIAHYFINPQPQGSPITS